jgi:hypothetical protein
MYLKRYIASALGAAILAVPACALARQPEHKQNRSDNAVVAPAVSRAAAPAGNDERASGASALADLGAAAESGEMEGTRGGSEVVTTEAALSGTLGGNTASQVATGNNVIQSGSFANAAGLPVVIQNSGANVLIQNATVINLQLK